MVAKDRGRRLGLVGCGVLVGALAAAHQATAQSGGQRPDGRGRALEPEPPLRRTGPSV